VSLPSLNKCKLVSIQFVNLAQVSLRILLDLQLASSFNPIVPIYNGLLDLLVRLNVLQIDQENGFGSFDSTTHYYKMW